MQRALNHQSNRGVVDWLNATFQHWSLLPAVLLFVGLTLYPMANLLRMSVSTIDFMHGSEVWSFTPGRNWASLLSDPALSPTIVNTLIFVVVGVVVEVILGLGLALLVASMTRGKGLLRTYSFI